MRAWKLLAAVAAAALAAPVAAQERPNILVIVTDDLGWSDLGAFGGEVDTPNLDRLALSGVRFTGFHTAPTCSPTRAMLLSGVDNHEAGLGTMAEMLLPTQRGRPGYEGYLNDRVASIAELLGQSGYYTVMAGKWHLGLTDDRSPAARGFDRSFALLPGLGNHFGADQDGAWKAAGLAPGYREDGKLTRLPEGAYSSDYFADKLISYIGAPRPAGKEKQPFFAYLAFSAPHWPLQAPRDLIAKYKGRYDAGPEVLREQRLAKQKRLGLIPADAKPHPLVGVTPWNQLTPEERAVQARKMEVYAAMVDRVDQDVGRVLDALKTSGQLDNTLILFTSDNGPEGNRMESPGRASGDVLASLGIDNRLDNLGNATSYFGYGTGWAQANSAPSRLVKGFTTEGGIRVAAFASGKGVRGGRISNALLHVIDVAPTLLEVAGLKQPAEYKGRPILPFEGHSIAPLLAGKAEAARPADETVSWELFDGRAVRRDNWKAVYLAPGRSPYLPAQGRGNWELYDLAADPGETTNLADREPERLRDLVAAWTRYAEAKGVIVPPAAN